MIESGLIFLNKFIKYRLINDLFIFKSNKNLKATGYNNSKFNHIKKYNHITKIKVNLGDDTLLKASVK